MYKQSEWNEAIFPCQLSHHFGSFFFKYLILKVLDKRTALFFFHLFLLSYVFSFCPWYNVYFHLNILEIELQA